MDSETQRQIRELEGLRSAHVSRLRVLETQQAHYGIDAPAHITIEIDEIGSKVEAIDKSLLRLRTAVPPLIDLSEEAMRIEALADSIRKEMKALWHFLFDEQDARKAGQRRYREEIRSISTWVRIGFIVVGVALGLVLLVLGFVWGRGV